MFDGRETLKHGLLGNSVNDEGSFV